MRIWSIESIAWLAIAVFANGALAQTTPPAQAPATNLKFSFGKTALGGHVNVLSDVKYTTQRGYGFDLDSRVQDSAGFVSGNESKPFFFSAKLAPGAYKVTVTLGDPASDSVTTIKSETRRLMAEAVHTVSGKLEKRTFLVHLRVPQLPDGRIVRLKARENQPILYVQWDENTQIPFMELDWDEKLTLEFSDAKPALVSVEITNAEKPTTIYLVGDSTMTDQMMEPYAAWGQMFPRWFKPPVLIANYAESGESAASFVGELRWAKLMSEVHAGDYVLIQFGINDQTLAPDRIHEYFGQFIEETRQHGAIPVLVTSQNLRSRAFDANGKAVNTLGAYPQVMRDIAKEKEAPLIDLNEMSMRLYQAIGQQDLPKAFVDGTHHNNYGAYELSKCVAQAVIDAKLPWAQNVVDDWKTFDPSKPDPIASFKLPPDPQLDPARPGGPGAPGGRGAMAGDAPRGGVRRGPATQAAPSQPAAR